MGRSPSRRAAQLLALATSLLLALCILEVGVRLSGLAPDLGFIERGRFRLSDNPLLGYEPVPATDYRGEDLRFVDYRGRSNALGYRDVDHPLEKPEGRLRIAVLGDSIAAGLRVERYEETFPAILQTELRRAGTPVDVLNFGVSGYNTVQEVETYRTRARAFEPDLVLLAYCLNDDRRVDGRILETLLEEQSLRPNVRPDSGSPPLLLRSALYRLLHYRASGPTDRLEQDGAAASASVAASFSRLADLTRDDGTEVLVAVFPRFKHLFRYRWQREHEAVAELSRRHGFHHLDLLDPYRACWPGAMELLSTDTWHPTPLGHRCAAEAMARKILELGRS